MTIIATMQFNDQAPEPEYRQWETSIYEEGGDRLVRLPDAATEEKAEATLRQYYPKAMLVSYQIRNARLRAAGYFLRGLHTSWRRSHFQCPDCLVELAHTSGEYSGEYGFLRHVHYGCPLCQAEWVDACELTYPDGPIHNWSYRAEPGPDMHFNASDAPPPLAKKNPWGFEETLLERRKRP